ncbi:MAG TPA: glycosyltransferase [Acidimicrobiales bacterium]|nr:glycosyltransferase [Acidimicrobiales bacterium]
MTASRVALELVRWLAGTWLLWRIRTCGVDTDDPPNRHLDLAGRAAMDEGEGLVVVVIPARDEEERLPRLLESLAVQDPRPAQVIVVDDASRDATAEVARSAGATVVAAGPLPAGWTGKSWACATGAEVAGAVAASRGDSPAGAVAASRGDDRAGAVAASRGENPGGAGTETASTAAPPHHEARPALSAVHATLVFLDADTTLAAGGLSRLLGEHRRRGGLVSVQPFHVMERPYEALSAFFNLVSMMGVGAFTPRRNARPAGAFGPCLVSSTADYAATGGHAHPDVRGRVVEDVALAQRFAGAGLPVSVLGGRGTISFRMYPRGLSQLVEGWTKNFATGASSTRPFTFVLISLWLSGCISAAWYMPAPAPLVVYLAYTGQLAWMLRRIGRFGWWPVLLYPVPLAFFLVVFARSLVLTHLRGEVRWRGRTISTRSPRPPRCP